MKKMINEASNLLDVGISKIFITRMDVPVIYLPNFPASFATGSNLAKRFFHSIFTSPSDYISDLLVFTIPRQISHLQARRSSA
jgi:hypothetical protein